MTEQTLRQIAEQKRGGHADEIETSRMLALRPDLVQMDRAVQEFTAPVPGAFGPTGIKKIHVGGKIRNDHGVNGNATLATAEKGEQSLSAMAEDIIGEIKLVVLSPIRYTP